MLVLPKNASVAVLTGAGISVSSGLPPFRGPGGIWNDIDVEDVVSAGGWARNPARVIEFLDRMRSAAKDAHPTAAHLALARAELGRTDGARFGVITQNIDGLHQRAGSHAVIEIHGSLEYDRCDRCFERYPHGTEACFCGRHLRPDVVLFGETLPLAALEASQQALTHCDYFVAIGTSGVVWPAANFVTVARDAGARCVNVNLERSGNPAFHDELIGPADELVPALFDG